ncbi:hypothetical protein DMP23_20895 [Amycolatopsis sp. A1MSW2902]
MLGRWNKPDGTAAALRNGWMHTGDSSYMGTAGRASEASADHRQFAAPVRRASFNRRRSSRTRRHRVHAPSSRLNRLRDREQRQTTVSRPSDQSTRSPLSPG